MKRQYSTSTMHKNGAQSVWRRRQGKEISRRERSRSELGRAHRRCEVKNNSFLRLTQHWRGDPDATADFYALLRSSFLIFIGALSVVGCHQSLFTAREGAPIISQSESQLAFDAIGLQELIVIDTKSDSASPSFGLEQRLVFRTGEDDPNQVSVKLLDLKRMTLQEVHSFDKSTYYDPYAYGGGYGDPYYNETYSPSPQPEGWRYSDFTHHPALLGDEVLLASGSFWSNDSEPSAYRLDLGSDKIRSFGYKGVQPLVSPDQKKVLLQGAYEISLYSQAGQREEFYPGFFPVWAPNSEDFLIHLTPYVVSNSVMGYPAWPEGLVIPSENVGGIALVHNDKIEALTELGGLPAWYPNGEAFIYEIREGDQTSLHRFDMNSKSSSPFLDAGTKPAIYGEDLVFFLMPSGELTISDGEQTKGLGIHGFAFELSLDQRYLALQRWKKGTAASTIELIILRIAALSPEESSAPIDLIDTQNL